VPEGERVLVAAFGARVTGGGPDLTGPVLVALTETAVYVMPTGRVLRGRPGEPRLRVALGEDQMAYSPSLTGWTYLAVGRVVVSVPGDSRDEAGALARAVAELIAPAA
jgi:hypothetical protein